MNEVWEVLDSEFAQEQEVVNAVDTELNDLDVLDCSVQQYIVKLRNYLPNFEKALRSANGLEHLHFPHRVNFLVSRFDATTLHDWNYFRSKSSGSSYE